MVWDQPLGSGCASEQEREEVVCALEFIMGWLCTGIWDVLRSPPGLPWAEHSVGSSHLLSHLSHTRCLFLGRKYSLRAEENAPGGLGQDSRRKWSCPVPQPRSQGRADDAVCPKSLNGEPEERFPNQKNPVSPQGFGEIEFLLPYLLMEGRGERGRLLDLKINQMALSV